jgi:hypothetical protein
MTQDRRTAARFRQKLASLVTSDINRVADVIVGVGKGQFTKSEAVDWLCRSEDGQALMKHLTEKERAMNPNDELLALAKRHGVVSIAKVILEDDKYARAITENDFVEMLKEEAKAYQKTGESVDQAFAKSFSADTSEGLLLRQAHAAIKKANFPGVVTERSVRKGEDTAFDKLVEKANRLRELQPELSWDQAFSRVFTNPVNAGLAQQERNENRPGPGASTSYPMPGGKH